MSGECCDMSCDVSASTMDRDTLRAWSVWVSTVIHGPRYEPDYGPRYEQDCGPRHKSCRRTTPRVGPPGRATRRATGPRYAPGSRAALRVGPRAVPHAGPTIASQRRWTYGPTNGGCRYIPMDIEAPCPWSLQPDSCTVREVWGCRPAARGGGEKPGNERLVRIINTQRMPRRVDLHCTPSPVLLD